ncbi:hypothetical protein KSD_54330 [Ktedonobacter sp. SOSP1-85]|nr:hypothetical protein KSD_54330 [Ktedonobacter sp. SOSP1-85]
MLTVSFTRSVEAVYHTPFSLLPGDITASSRHAMVSGVPAITAATNVTGGSLPLTSRQELLRSPHAETSFELDIGFTSI